MQEEANRVVKETLSGHQVPALEEGLVQEAEKILKAYEEEVDA